MASLTKRLRSSSSELLGSGLFHLCASLLHASTTAEFVVLARRKRDEDGKRQIAHSQLQLRKTDNALLAEIGHLRLLSHPLIRPAFDLLARPFKPVRVFCEYVRDDTGVHQDHAVPRVKRSQLFVLPLTRPPRNNVASTRSPRETLPALTTSTPSGWSTNLTSCRGNNPCFRRIAGRMVTWPLLEIFMLQFSLNQSVGSRMGQRTV